jgi:hypothetical protein
VLLKCFTGTNELREFVHLWIREAEVEVNWNAPEAAQVANLTTYTENHGLTGELIRLAVEETDREDLAELQWQYYLLRKLEDALGPDGNKPSADAARAYAAAWPERGEEPWIAGSPRSPLDYAWHLIEAHVLSDGRIPLLVFARLLHPVFPRPELKDWEEQALSAFAQREEKKPESLRDALGGATSGPAPGADDSAWLLVRVDTSEKEPGKYRVWAWLFDRGHPEGEPVSKRSEPEVAADGIEAEVIRFRNEAMNLYRGDKLPIEVFLPDELYGQCVDQWERRQELADDPLPLGFDHPVVIRCLRLAKAGTIWPRIQQRWKELVTRAAACTVVEEFPLDDKITSAAYWHALPDSTGGLYRELFKARSVGCVILGSPPQPGQEQKVSQTLSRILEAGVPLVLWARRLPPGEDLKTLLTDLVKPGALNRLHDRVWKVRQQFDEKQPPEHFCRNVTLVYEDPQRLPPDAQHQRSRAPEGRST